MRLRTRLLLFGLAILLATSAGAAVIAVLGVRALEDQAFDQLRSVRESKAAQIEDEVARFLGDVSLIAQAPTVKRGLMQLPPAFAELGKPIDNKALTDYYERQFAPRVILAGEESSAGVSTSLAPGTDSGRKLQDLYIANNPWPVGEKAKLVDAGDDSRYSAAHAQVHRFLRSALATTGAYDIFLIDPAGTVVYSVDKEIDVGSSLSAGPLADSGLAEAWRVSQDNDGLAVTDFAPYLPSYGEPAAFAADAVRGADGSRLGTIAMQLPVDRINEVMTSGGQWGDIGLGSSGETYLVAEDLTMRNDSRFLIEATEDYYAAVGTITDEDTLAKIEAFNSSIGLQRVDTAGTRAALGGADGEQTFEDYRGVPVLSSYRPLELGDAGLTWVIMSEIDQAEAFGAVSSLARAAIVVLVVVVVIVVVAVIVVSARLTRPLTALERETEEVEVFDFAGAQAYDASRLDKVAERKDEIGDLAGAFSRMTATLGENVRSRVEVESELNVAAEIQQSMLPLTFPSFPELVEFQIHARVTPAKEIGGDFFEHGFVDADHFFFAVGDVSGKGIPAALFMAAIKTLIRSGALQGEQPAELLTRVNDELSRDNPEMMFATVWLGILDLRDGTVVFTNGGHNLPALAGGETVTWIPEVNGPMVGPINGATYDQASLQLAPGGLLVVFSDGVTEAMSPAGQQYGEQRLARVLASAGTYRSDQVTEAVVDDVIAWEAGSARSDDVTVLALRYLGAGHAADYEQSIPLNPTGTITPELADELSRANQKVADFARGSGLDAEAIQRVQIVMDEVLTNSATHSDAARIFVRAWLESGALSVEISDDGAPHNPLAVQPPDTEVTLEDRAIGGLGIHLVRNLTSDLRYRFIAGRNLLTFRVGSGQGSESG